MIMIMGNANPQLNQIPSSARRVRPSIPMELVVNKANNKNM
jgi:hypothetical protein